MLHLREPGEMDAEEYAALRDETIAKHNAAIAVFSGTIALVAAVVGLAKPPSGPQAAVQVIVAAVALHLVVAGSALVIIGLFNGTNRISGYLVTFHEGRGKVWETANRRFHSGVYFSQSGAMGWVYTLVGLLIFAYSTYSLLETDSRGTPFLVALLGVVAVAQTLVTTYLVDYRRRFPWEACLAEWERVRRELTSEAQIGSCRQPDKEERPCAVDERPKGR